MNFLNPIKTNYTYFRSELSGTRKREYNANSLKNKGMLVNRSEEHTSELQSHWYISYAVFCLKKKKKWSNRE